MPLGLPLRRSFYERDPRVVARDLIGCRLVHRLASGERIIARLTEVEAYLGDGSDPAAHSHGGPTSRNATMFGPAGRLYAYRSYGIHTCVNVVCGPTNAAAAVLLRGAEPLSETATIAAWRGLERTASGRTLLVGPGRLGQGMGLALSDDGRSLLRGALTLHGRESGAVPRIGTGPRVGITKAAALPWRFFETDENGAPSVWVSAFRTGGRSRASRR